MCQPEINCEQDLARKCKHFLSAPFILTLIFGALNLLYSRISCVSSLQIPIVIIQGLLTLISLTGLVFICSKKPVAVWIPLFVSLLILVLHLSTIVLMYVAGGELSGSGNKEYRIEDYSRWLRAKVDTDSKWNKVRSCAVRGRCKVDNQVRQTSPIQSGCCKPPSECGFVHKGAAVWVKAAAGAVTSNNTDCAAWGSDRSVLCYDCQSCKAAVLAITKSDWEHLAPLSFAVLAFYGLILCWIFSSVCSALRKRKTVPITDWNDTSLPVVVHI